jgi:tetratricopeptide (TPR) repeat protein
VEFKAIKISAHTKSSSTFWPQNLLLFGIVAFFLTIAGGSAYFTFRPSANAFEDAINSLKNGDFKKSESAFRKIVQKGTHSHEALSGLARSLISQARQDYNKESWKQYGKNADDLMPHPKLEEAIAILLPLAKNHAESSYLLGYIYLNKGQNDKALECFARIGSENSFYTESRNGLATAYFQKGQYERAETILKNCIKENPQFPLSYKNLVALYFTAKRDYKNAEIYWNHYRKLTPGGKDHFFLKRELDRIGPES